MQKEKEREDSWVARREDNKVYAKDGNILFQCPYCKSTYFVSETELEQHIRAFHTGYLRCAQHVSEVAKHG
jgi:uncharacterized C2H2 Zn-finger protein